jgi:hypothetical protein
VRSPRPRPAEVRSPRPEAVRYPRPAAVRYPRPAELRSLRRAQFSPTDGSCACHLEVNLNTIWPYWPRNFQPMYLIDRSSAFQRVLGRYRGLGTNQHASLHVPPLHPMCLWKLPRTSGTGSGSGWRRERGDKKKRARNRQPGEPQPKTGKKALQRNKHKISSCAL